jgi:hypothetical protein
MTKGAIMSDVKCPYCEHEQEINHDDGYGYDEDRKHEQACTACRKYFQFQTSISYDYEVFCRGEHDIQHCGLDSLSNFFECTRCDYSELRFQQSSDAKE